MKTTVRLTESAVMLAAAFALSFIPVVNMPFGGSVTLCSMLPVALIAYRHGLKWGLVTGFAASLLQLLLGLNNLSYATSWLAVVAIILLDYVLAFTALGLAGVFRKTKLTQTAALVLGVLLCCAVRYACHFVSGVTVWRDLSAPLGEAVAYSLAYNAAYMVPETIITVAAATALSTVLDLGSPRPRSATRAKGQGGAVIAALAAIVCATASAVTLFAAVQTDDGFSIAAATTTQWIIVGATAAAAVIGSVAAVMLARRKRV